MELNISDIIEATGGRLLGGSPESSISGVTIDSRAAGGGDLFVPLQGTQHDGHAFIESAIAGGASGSLLQRGNPAGATLAQAWPGAALVEVADPLTALGDIAGLWRRRCSATVIAITGSNGKTTTKEMTWAILKEHLPCMKNPGNFNNLIGLPLS
ncbi:Mur ligase domain-containing protein, partial [Thermodesulfobacteriota bacterium]